MKRFTNKIRSGYGSNNFHTGIICKFVIEKNKREDISAKNISFFCFHDGRYYFLFAVKRSFTDV